MSILVHGWSLLTGRLDEPEIPGGGLVIEDGAIVAVGPAAGLRTAHAPAREIGGPDRIVIPGLASAHQHGGGVSSVQLGCPDQPFERWMIEMLGVPPADPYLDTLVHAVRLIENGITCTIHSHYTRDAARYDQEVEGHLRAWAESGMRVAFAPCFLNDNQLVYESNEDFLRSLPAGLAAAARQCLDLGPSLAAYCDLVSDLHKRFAGNERARVLLGPAAPQWCTTEAMERLAAEASHADGIHTHLLESPAQRTHLDAWLGRSVVTWLDELGLVSPAASFAHGVWLRPREMALLGERGARVVHNPGSNLRLRNGFAPVRELRAAGVPIALGTDEMTLNDDDDLLAEARFAGQLARLRGARLAPADLLNMASEQGAAAARFGDVTGTITAGKRADVVLVDAARLADPAVVPGVPALDLLLARGLGSDVRTVLIDGEVVYDQGRHTWIDRETLAGELRAVLQAQAAQPRWQSLADMAGRLACARDSWLPAGGQPAAAAGPAGQLVKSRASRRTRPSSAGLASTARSTNEAT